MKKTIAPAEQVYRTVIDGRVITGTKSEIAKAIADWRENR